MENILILIALIFSWMYLKLIYTYQYIFNLLHFI